MADTGAQQQVNGSPSRAAAPDLLPGPNPLAQAQARVRAHRASTLAALESGDTSEKPAVEKPAVEKPKAEPVAEPEGDDDAAAEAPTEEAKPELEAKADAPDADSSKRLASIQAKEKHSRDKIAAERGELAKHQAAFEKLRADNAPRLEKLDRFEAALKKLRADPDAADEALLLLELGDNASREAFARAAFATTDAGKKDPAVARAHAAKATELLRNRETETAIEKLQRELTETREMITNQAQAQTRQAETARYVTGIETAAKTSAPLVAHLLATDPDDTHDGLVKVYSALMAEHGEVPDAADVVAVYEKAQRARFTKLGINPESMLKTTTKQNDQQADKKHPAKTLGNDLSTPRVPRPNKSDREHRAETLQMLESGKLEH